MKIQALLSYVILISGFAFSSCSPNKNPKPSPTIEGRWFTKAQYKLGRQVYTNNCSRCHGEYGQSTVANWKERNPDGSFPPPPLDGTAHTWHHPFSVLMKTINEGGANIGGTMPPFGEQLTEEEKIAVIAYFQSLWDDKTYERWVNMNSRQTN